jgi:carbamoyl-phosphate synthase large subunit
VLGKNPLLFDRYLSDATEVDVDCLCDGTDTFVVGIMEHIEEAGIHSGDSACSLPPYSLDAATIAELERQTRELALGLDVVGLMNVQYAIKDGEIYVLEVNPRASRSAVRRQGGRHSGRENRARIMAGEKLADFKLTPRKLNHVGVKDRCSRSRVSPASIPCSVRR